MNNEEVEVWREKEIAATNYRSKLRVARERKGLTKHEAAQLIGTIVGSDSNYYDIEENDRDFTYCYSLDEITKVCEKLDLHPRNLFCDKTLAAISILEVVERIKTHCIKKKISIGEFENIAGWKLEGCLSNPADALDNWNIDCLIDISRELQIDWRCVIASL
jgi:transcriptional regulator with XRE-family HTH domain